MAERTEGHTPGPATLDLCEDHFGGWWQAGENTPPDRVVSYTRTDLHEAEHDTRLMEKDLAAETGRQRDLLLAEVKQLKIDMRALCKDMAVEPPVFIQTDKLIAECEGGPNDG